jgi:putative membrane protein
MNKTMIAALLLSASILPGYAQDAAPNPAQDLPRQQQMAAVEDEAPLTAEEFINRVSESNEFEIRSSQAVLEKVSPEVREFADMLIDEHSAAGEKMKAIADEAGITIADGAAVGAVQETEISQLAGAHPSTTNNLFLDIQVQAHSRAVAMFKSYIENGEDGPVKAFAEESLPTLEAHLAHAEKLQGSLGE